MLHACREIKGDYPGIDWNVPMWWPIGFFILLECSGLVAHGLIDELSAAVETPVECSH